MRLSLLLPVALAATFDVAAQTPVQVPLAFNFNGIAHAGETGAPDAANGFRSISDRALDFTGGVPNLAVFTRFAVVTTPGVLDMVHLGNRNTVDNGNWAFDSFPDGDSVGTQPAWLASADQSGPQVTTIATPLPIGAGSSATVLFHVSNGGGSCDVTFGYASGASSTHTINAPDWFGGSIPGRDSVDEANPGADLNLVEAVVDLSGDAGEQLTSIAFANRSNQGAGYGIYGVNVVPDEPPLRTNQIALDCNWNGIVHAGEANQPDAPNGFRSIADRALDFTSGVPASALLDEFALVDQAGVLDCVMLGNRNAAGNGSLAFDAVPDGDDVGVQPSWLANPNQSGPLTTVLPVPVLLDAASSASFLFQISHGGGAFDVTFTFATGAITATLRGGDWVGGPFAGTGAVDRALPGPSLHVEREDVDLGPLQGLVLTAITFSNFSNPNGCMAVIAANVTGCLACTNPGGPMFLGGGAGPVMTTTSDGTLGCPLEWTITGATPGTAAGFWALGFGAVPQPLALVWPQCTSTLHVLSPLLVAAAVDPTGGATLQIPTADPSLCGQVVSGQYVELMAAPCPVLLSDALAFTVGN